jgi:uncharacterized Rossmann fold enzyme
MKLDEAMRTVKVCCRVCGQTMEVHAHGKNKQILKKLDTKKEVTSMACWTRDCPLKGQEQYYYEGMPSAKPKKTRHAA